MEKSESGKRREKRRDLYHKILSRLKCEICGETGRGCLSFHHLDHKEKEYAVSDMVGSYSPETLLKEISKCACLCLNCHLKIHHLTPVDTSQFNDLIEEYYNKI